MTTHNQINQTDLIVNALAKKSKKTLAAYPNRLRRQALHFSPAYRDFIYNIIKSSCLKIKHQYRQGYTTTSSSEGRVTLSKRMPICVYADISEDLDTLPHELGHAVDFWFGNGLILSTTVLIKDDKTLFDIFTEEFDSSYQKIYEDVMNEYKNIINSTINDKAYSIFTKYLDTYKKLDNTPYENRSLRKKLQKELYESGFMEVYSQIYLKNCYQTLNNKYGPILDALSSKYDFDYIFLSHHTPTYYSTLRDRPVTEFFANVFGAKVTSNHTQYDNLIKYLPKSFDAFEKLFVLFYDRLQNNKRFLDIPLIKLSPIETLEEDIPDEQ